MVSWELPNSVEIYGVRYSIYTDYRDILDIIANLNDEENTEQERFFISLALFYEDFDEMPLHHYNEAINELFSFINCYLIDDRKPRPKTIDWEQDYFMIASEINKIVGSEVRAVPYMHWFTFIGYFNSIGEGQLSTIVSIREKKRKNQKLDKGEQEFYKDNKNRIDFKVKYTEEEDEERKRLLAMLGG